MNTMCFSLLIFYLYNADKATVFAKAILTKFLKVMYSKRCMKYILAMFLKLLSCHRPNI